MVFFALFSWPVIIAALAAQVRWPVVILISLLGGYLLLPSGQGINLPLLPPLNKETLSVFTLFLLALILRPGAVGTPGTPDAGGTWGMPSHLVRPGWRPASWVGTGLIAIWLLGAFGTALTNRDPLIYGDLILPGMRLYDAFSVIINTLGALVTLLLARKYFAYPEMHRLLIAGFAIAALLYSLPTLYEVRMSPQINVMIYGYFPHEWSQHFRGTGFRPVVFLSHALWLSLFLGMGVLACLGLAKLAPTSGQRMLFGLGAAWLFVTLILAKSLGALLITAVLGLVILVCPKRIQVMTAGVIAAMVLLYPMLRNLDLIPFDPVINLAASIDINRANSFGFRIDNEDALLARAAERPVFGWGGWNRSRIFSEEGYSLSTTDGAWIIAFGSGGWVNYIARFGLLMLPIIALAFRPKRYNLTPETAVLALLLAANATDMIPNATETPLTWLLAGALLGRMELAYNPSPDAQAQTEAAPPPRAAPVYTRQSKRHTRKPAASQPAGRRIARPQSGAKSGGTSKV
jgi:hypothetical protein